MQTNHIMNPTGNYQSFSHICETISYMTSVPIHVQGENRSVSVRECQSTDLAVSGCMMEFTPGCVKAQDFAREASTAVRVT